MSTPLRLLRETSVQRAQADPAVCSYPELVTALINVPNAAMVAGRILAVYPTAFDLGRADPADLLAIPGVGPQTAAGIRAACELARRSAAPHPARPITSAADAAGVLRPYLAHREQEYLVVLVLNTRNHLIGGAGRGLPRLAPCGPDPRGRGLPRGHSPQWRRPYRRARASLGRARAQP